MTTGKEPLSRTVWLALTFGKLLYCQKSISVICEHVCTHKINNVHSSSPLTILSQAD